jgi:hypothetical protein
MNNEQQGQTGDDLEQELGITFFRYSPIRQFFISY